MKNKKIQAEYIWMDGGRVKGDHTQKLRSKTKVIDNPFLGGKLSVEKLPIWSFDGSSTNQGVTGDSDRILKPVKVIPDPMRGGKNVLVLCEVMNPDGSPHQSNTRAMLRKAVEKYKRHKPWFGMEQEYTLYDKNGARPYRWPDGGSTYPAPQFHYYCGVGCDEIYGSHLIEEHTAACIDAGISIEGTNAEVMAAQWEFQIGILPPLEMADELWLARYLLYTVGVKHGISIKLSPKPISGDWNGAGMHTNFSTKEMRAKGGERAVKAACEKLKKFHSEHIAVYGVDNDKRLTGEHETAPIRKFRYAARDRGASVRIPISNANRLEDRRPAANADPYKIVLALLETVCGKGFVLPEGWKRDVKI